MSDKKGNQMRVLGIETSCDETGVAIYSDTQGLMAHRVHSQIEVHAHYGGVVPELASRDHVRYLRPLVDATISDACIKLSDIDSIRTLSLKNNIIGVFEEYSPLTAGTA